MNTPSENIPLQEFSLWAYFLITPALSLINELLHFLQLGRYTFQKTFLLMIILKRSQTQNLKNRWIFQIIQETHGLFLAVNTEVKNASASLNDEFQDEISKYSPL